SVISLLSLFILMLSISLLMEKNRYKLHSLLMLGYNPGDVATPYWNIISIACCGATLLSAAAIAVLRAFYLSPLRGLGAEGGSFWTTILTLLIMVTLIISLNFLSVYRRVISTWR
ncbi:MAG: ABC transporter permease, partial [Muribaculaceae bacterium]|nr:ABC transporter permease [Muribaculaceae bacterium]